jgi:hypothetical protein
MRPTEAARWAIEGSTPAAAAPPTDQEPGSDKPFAAVVSMLRTRQTTAGRLVSFAEGVWWDRLYSLGRRSEDGGWGARTSKVHTSTTWGMWPVRYLFRGLRQQTGEPVEGRVTAPTQDVAHDILRDDGIVADSLTPEPANRSKAVSRRPRRMLPTTSSVTTASLPTRSHRSRPRRGTLPRRSRSLGSLTRWSVLWMTPASASASTS